MNNAADDVQRKRTFGTTRYLRRHLPFALLMLVLGIFVLSIADSSRRADREGILAGFVLLGAGLIYFGYFFCPRKASSTASRHRKKFSFHGTR